MQDGGQWEMLVDVGKKLQFPRIIATTSLRPDIVLWSSGTKKVAMVELTVPWEERPEEAHHLKSTKYSDLQLECAEQSRRADERTLRSTSLTTDTKR